MDRHVRHIGGGRAIALVTVLVLLVGAWSCRNPTGGGDEYVYQPPLQTGDGWETASVSDVGMDTEPFINMMNGLLGRDSNLVHGIVVARDGKLVFEAYFPGEQLDLSNLSNGLAFQHDDFDRTTLHCLASASKSVTSVLLGIAIDAGLVPGTDATMFSFFPEDSLLRDSVKDQITLAHMLAMASGLPWNESYPYDDPRNDLVAEVFSDDPIGYVLGKSTVAMPGTRFIYNSGTTNLLGEVVRRSSGMTLWDFAEQRLFAPLGITSYAWYAFPTAPDMAVASSTLFLRPRDMAKIGQLVLNGGLWNGTRIVSPSWLAASTTKVMDISAAESPVPRYLHGYGLQWWLGTFATGSTDFYAAAGWGGQFVLVLPDPRIVVVITAGDFEGEDYAALLGLVDNYVLRAIQ